MSHSVIAADYPTGSIGPGLRACFPLNDAPAFVHCGHPPAASSGPQATFDYLAGPEWISKVENLCLVGPAGTGKSHLLVALGHAPVAAGHKGRYPTAAKLVEQLYRGVADNSVGRVIDTWSDMISSLSMRSGSRRWTTPERSCCSGSSPPPTNVAPSESRHIGRTSSGDGSRPNTSPRPACSTGCFTTPPVVVTEGESIMN